MGLVVGLAAAILLASIGLVVWLQGPDERSTVRPSDVRACQFIDRAVMTPYPQDRTRFLRKAEHASVPTGQVHEAIVRALQTDEAGDWYSPAAQKLLQACEPPDGS
jgi:hypothetical protein